MQYAFKVITHLDGLEHTPDLVYNTKDEQIALLQSVLLANETDAELGSDVKASFGDLPGTVTSKDFGRAGGHRPDGAAAPKRITGSLGALSGAQAMSYIERYVACRLTAAYFAEPRFHIEIALRTRPWRKLQRIGHSRVMHCSRREPK